jgi:hypothetical protein
MKRGGSNHGFHFYQLDKKCPWKFYLMYRKGIFPRKTPEALLNGSAYHAGKEAYYLNNYNLKVALDAIYNSLEENEGEYEDKDLFTRAWERVPAMFADWHEKVGQHDKRNLDIIYVEHELEVPIAGTNYTITMKLDLVARDKNSGYINIYDTKTTSFSKASAVSDVEMSDQSTTYLWGFSKTYPKEKVDGFIGDISYWHKSTTDPKKIEHTRTDVIRRTPRTLMEFESALAYEITDISARMQAVDSGKFPAYTLFPRRGASTGVCNEFFRRCPFEHICRDVDLDKSIPLPANLYLDETNHTLTDMIGGGDE